MENFVILKMESKIKCNSKEKIKDLCQRFISQSGIDISKIDFLYKGKKIIQDLTFQKIANEKDIKNKIINIIIKEENNINNKENLIKFKEIICPKCNENILMKIKDYKIILYDCKNHHKINNISFGEFGKFLHFDLSKIICKICNACNGNKNNLNKINEFFICNKCKINLCQKCKSFHDKNHKLYSYESKNSICLKHSMHFVKYCKDCKLNICMKCENDHKDHNCTYLGEKLKDNEDEIKKEMNELKVFINKLNNDIDGIIRKLNTVKNNIGIYFNEANDIINYHYYENTINYEILENIKEIKQYNNSLKNNINTIINDNNIYNKFKNIIQIYEIMEKKEPPVNLKFQLELFKSCSSEFEIFLSKDNELYMAEEKSGFLKIYSLFINKLIKTIKFDKIKQLKYFINNKNNNEYLVGISQEENNNKNEHSYFIVFDITNNYQIKLQKELNFYINNYCLAFPPNHDNNYIILSPYKSSNNEDKIMVYSLNNFQFIKEFDKLGKSGGELLTFHNKKENKYYIIYMNSLLINLFEDNKYEPLSSDQQNGFIFNKNNIDYLCCYYRNGINIWDLYNKKIFKTIKINYLCCFIQWNNNYLIGFSADDHAFKIINLEEGTYETNYINNNRNDSNNNPTKFMKKIFHPRYGESLITDSIGNSIILWSP